MRRQGWTHGVRCAGFTLIEIICVLVLLGLTALVSTRMFTNMIRGYVLARNSDAAVQKAQNAMQRMTIDFTYLQPSASTGTANTVTYNVLNAANIIISQSGNRIMYSVNGTGYILTDGVQANSLTFSYYNTYNGTALTSMSSSTNIVGFSYTMVGDDTSQGLSQNYATRVTVNKVH